MNNIYSLLITLVCLACSSAAQEEQVKITTEYPNPGKKYHSFSGQPIEYSAEADTVYLTLKGKNGEMKSLWSILSHGATAQQYMAIIKSELTDEDPSEAHKVFHVAYVHLGDSNYFYLLAGQIGETRYAERLIDFQPYR